MQDFLEAASRSEGLPRIVVSRLTERRIHTMMRMGLLAAVDTMHMTYRGKITTTGSSEAIELDKELFRQSPEFKQQAEVRADVIGPGTMLISLLDKTGSTQEEDTLVGAFLAFMERDSSQS